MYQKIDRFWSAQEGTGLMEYTIILAFVLFTVIGLAAGYHSSIAGVATVTNQHLASAHTSIH